MSEQQGTKVRKLSIGQRWKAFLRTRFWKMDIHPTAWIAGSALIDRTWPRGIHIAAGCIIDEQAVVLTHDMTRGVYLDTSIGESTIVGARAIILPGLTIGSNCQIAPGSVVIRDVPDGTAVAGNPAKVIENS